MQILLRRWCSFIESEARQAIFYYARYRALGSRIKGIGTGVTPAHDWSPPCGAVPQNICVQQNVVAAGRSGSYSARMSSEGDKLSEIAQLLRKGVAPPKATVRSFLLWFNAERRGGRVVRHIRNRLAEHKVATDPDFEFQYIDDEIGFKVAVPESEDERPNRSPDLDPTYRVGRLAAANKPPLSVKPDSTLQEIITLMLSHDYSQLPVMTGSRDVKGVVSWKLIGSRLALKRPCAVARDCMEPPQIISSEESLFAAISFTASRDYVLVRARDQQISGIVTASDFNEQFQKLAEPFLLVGEIENGLRRMLHGKFDATDLKAAKVPGDDGREIQSVADLTFGEYIRLIQTADGWSKLKIEIDRVEFIKRLDKIREIRNDVMHFDPDGLEESDLATLREFASFLKQLRDAGAV